MADVTVYRVDEEEEGRRMRLVYCCDLGPDFHQCERKQPKHWPTNIHLPPVTPLFLKTYSPCTHTETDQKAIARCKRSPGVKSMAVKAKVINYGMWGDGGVDKLPERKIEKNKTGFIHLPCTVLLFSYHKS